MALSLNILMISNRIWC